jgi:glycosyltransferase involved in cell wall biosynthesis
LRILMVTARYLPHVGGTEIHTAEVARRLVAAGHQVTVLTTDYDGILTPLEVVDGITVLRVPTRPRGRDYYFAPSIIQIVGQPGRWDLVHCQGYHTLFSPLGMLAARRAGLPYVVSFHSGGNSSRLRNLLRPAQWALLRPLLRDAAKLICVSQFERGFFRDQLRLPETQFEVIQNGSSLHVPQDSGRLPPDPNLIVSVGRLERYKGHQRIMAALPSILKHHPQVQLRIAGSGPYEDDLRQLADQLGVADRVTIGGVPANDRQGMANLLMSAGLVVLMSEYEAHSVSAVEALSLGCSMLVADTSNLHELAEQGFAQAVPLHSTPQHLATVVGHLLDAPLSPPTINVPTWEVCATAHQQLYANIVKGG